MSLAQRIVGLLNEVHKLNPDVLSALVEFRVQLDDEEPLMKSDIPIVVVSDDGLPKLGMLGILNGVVLSEDKTSDRITAIYDDVGKLTHFALSRMDSHES